VQTFDTLLALFWLRHTFLIRKECFLLWVVRMRTDRLFKSTYFVRSRVWQSAFFWLTQRPV
jgi:hypothetical protein